METGFTEGTDHRALIDIVNADLAVGPYAAIPTTGHGHLSETNHAFDTWLRSERSNRPALQGVNVGDDPDWPNSRFPAGRNAYVEEMTIDFSERDDRKTTMVVLIAYISLTDSSERGPADPADPNDSTPSQLFMPGTAHNSEHFSNGIGNYGYDSLTWDRMVVDRTHLASANADE